MASERDLVPKASLRFGSKCGFGDEMTRPRGVTFRMALSIAIK